MRNCKSFALVWILLCLLSTSGCNAPGTPVTGNVDAAVAAVKSVPPGLTLQQTWEENYPFYQKISALPYNQELLSGKLDETTFRDFIIQDYHFLQNYKKVHGILLAKAPDEAASRFMVSIIRQIDDEIASLHSVYIKKYNITDQELTEPTA